MMGMIGSLGLMWVTVLAQIPAGTGTESGRQSRRTPIVEAFEQARDAVVSIQTTEIVKVRSSLPFDDFFGQMFDWPTQPRLQKRQSIGSGFVIHEQGYIVTNAHVVRGTTECKVVFADKSEYEAKIVSTDREHDLAVLRIKAERSLKRIRLGRSDDLMVGETVIAIGNPLGYQHTVTTGVISAVGRELDFESGVAYKNLIQTDAGINPGNSGGPLLNINGELIGINTAIRGDAQNIGFAIPVDSLVDLLHYLLNIETKRPIRLGMEVGGRDTAVITDVLAEGPASKAGLMKGDLLVGLDGHPIRSAVDFYVALQEKEPGSEIKLSCRRNGAPKLITLTPGQTPDWDKLARAKLGIGVQPIPPRDAQQVRLPTGVGLRVVAVERGGPADRTGIQAGDILVQVDRSTVNSLNDLGPVLETRKSGDSVFVKIIRVYQQTYELFHGEIPVR
jgi:serine protease Do